MYIFKPPRVGGEVTIHQDASFLYTEPITVTGFWLALHDATLENGCLWAMPGGHKESLRNRFVRDGQGGTRFDLLNDQPLPEKGYTALPVKAGSLVILHGLLPHYSEVNRSAHPRHAYAVHLIDRRANYPDNNWLSPYWETGSA